MRVIGVFDSGVGGLSVVQELLALEPDVNVLYVADQARAPYGNETLETVRKFSIDISDWLIAQGCNPIVVACNTASAAALHHLRALYPSHLFVGMEPALKPAAGRTRSGTVGVLATRATFQSELFASVVERFAGDVHIVERVCDGWVQAVESGDVAGRYTLDLVRRDVEPVIDSGADHIVLGCTHYSFLSDIIQRVAGPDIRVVDPSGAVAGQAVRVAAGAGALNKGRLTLATSGPVDDFRLTLGLLTDLDPTEITRRATP